MISNHKLIPLFTIQDVKTSIYSYAAFGNLTWDTDDAGIRHFIGFLKDSFVAYRWFNPSDYRLFRIGYFDIDSGEIVADKPELILDGASLDISDWERGESSR